VSDDVLRDLFVEQGVVDKTFELAARLPPPAALGALERMHAEKHRAIALRVERGRVVVGMLDPSDTVALEKIAFYTGLAVEPTVVAAGVLFRALEKAYGVMPAVPDVTFMRTWLPRRGHVGDDVMPPPTILPAGLPPPTTSPSMMRARERDDDVTASHDIARAHDSAPELSTEGTKEALDPSASPLARSLYGLTDDATIEDAGPRSALSLAMVSDLRPASTPAVKDQPPPEPARAARDSLPPQVLPLLVPPFRAAALFLVRDQMAIGWDGLGGDLRPDDIRDLLLPLSGTSAFQRAWEWGLVSAGNPRDPTTIERTFFRCLRGPVPCAFAVLPILVGKVPVALLYVDRTEGPLDDKLLASVRQCGMTLADGLAPLVAEGRLFMPPPNSPAPNVRI
jgi:hypothetical protein